MAYILLTTSHEDTIELIKSMIEPLMYVSIFCPRLVSESGTEHFNCFDLEFNICYKTFQWLCTRSRVECI